MYHSVVLIVAVIITGGQGSSSYCLQHQCATQLSLRRQYCCNTSNLGEIITVTDSHRPSFILCPSTLPQSCGTIFTSCKDILTVLPQATSGYYNITMANGSIVSVYCNMEGCDGEGGWTRVAYLNMSDPSQQCPNELNMYDESGVRGCGRWYSLVASCNSVTLSTNGVRYSEVTGRVIGYQWKTPNAVENLGGVESIDINSPYVDGVSITHGSPRQHIWTFMGGLREGFNTDYECPCNTGSTTSVPSFIGNDYYCESANPLSTWPHIFFPNDPLWDGEDCEGLEGPCCTGTCFPWFHKVLNSSTTDDIELRVCGDQETDNEDTPINLYEIYIK